MAATAPNIPEMGGTTNWAPSICSKIVDNTLNGSEFPYKVPQVKGFRAPTAQMFSPPHLPDLKLDTSTMFFSNFWYPAFETTTAHDHYSEQLALGPEDQSGISARSHYSDKEARYDLVEEIALFYEERQELRGRSRKASISKEDVYDYVEELALSPVYKESRKLPRRGWKKSKAKDTKESGPEYAEVLALSPVCKHHREIPRRSRKKICGQHDRGRRLHYRGTCRREATKSLDISESEA
jgi:hypothetical protein